MRRIRRAFYKIHKDYPELIDKFGIQPIYKKAIKKTVGEDTLYSIPVKINTHSGSCAELLSNLSSIANLLEKSTKVQIVLFLSE